MRLLQSLYLVFPFDSAAPAVSNRLVDMLPQKSIDGDGRQPPLLSWQAGRAGQAFDHDKPHSGLTSFRRIVPQLGLLVLLVFGGGFSGQVGSSGNFELFKAGIAEPAKSYRLEFLEGDVHHEPATKLEDISGRLAIRQTQKRYHAIYQKNGFLLSQVPEIVAVGADTNVKLFVDCGRNGGQGWVRRDSAFVRLVDLDIVSTDATVQTIVEEVTRRENLVCCACFYGLPPMDVSTIKWDGLQFYAMAADGNAVNGRVSIDPTNGLVSAATYDAYNSQGKSSESATVRYSYLRRKDVLSMPNMIEKAITRAADPFAAARNSFTIKLIEREDLPSVFDNKEFNPSRKGWHYMISNGIPLTKVSGRFLNQEELNKVRGPSQRGIRSSKSISVRRVIVILAGISSFAILGWLVRKQKQNAQSII
jgi:hypothetical protein